MESIRHLYLLRGVALAIFLPACIYILVDYIRVLCLRQRLPPGPFPWPVVGNHFQVKLPRPWLWLDELSQRHANPLITLWRGHRPMIFFHDAWEISELLDKRSHIYSSRPQMVMLGDSRNATHRDQAVLPYGDAWRHHRRLTHNVVGSQAVRAHRPIQDTEIKVMLQDLVQQPENFVKAIERYSVSVVSCVGFGRRIEKMDDIVARMALKFMEGVDLAIPGEFLIESLPLLLKLPPLVYPLASQICANNRKMTRFFTLLSREAAAATGDTAPHTASRTHSFSASLMQESEKGKLSDEEIAFLTGNLIGGGVDTTSSTTISFIFAMCAFPAVQQRAFAEISSLVQPGDRMPDWADEENLPYCRALVSECLRWRTVTILGGIPHAPIQDDVYKGYTIPKGTWIAGNMWSIHRNPRDFPDPDQFRPERFLDERRPFPNKKGHSAFGWGRRQCSGQPLAEQGLFLTFARLLWAFEMRPALDRSGKEEKLDIFAFTESENIRPEPFGARFIPRNEARRAIIMQEATLARAYLKDFDGVTSVQMPCFE